MRSSILYYPHIEIQNLDWLKSTLLLWDNVYRIVPNGYKPKDNDEILKASDLGLVRAVDLDSKDMSGITNDFHDFLEELQYKPAGLEYEEISYLHPGKIDSVLYPSLERYTLGHSDEGFIELPTEVVRGYMFFLSTQVATRRNLSRCTDDMYSFAVAPYFSEMANFDDYLYDKEALGFYSSLIFQDILPINIGSIPIEKIVQASNSSKDEREQFKIELNNFSEQLYKCENAEHGKMILNDFRDDLVKAKEELKASQGFMNKDDIGSLFTIGIPTSAGVYGALLGATGDPFALYNLSTSLIIGAIASYQDYKKVKSVSDNPSGAGYLLSLEKRFSGTGKYPAFDRYLEEFIND